MWEMAKKHRFEALLVVAIVLLAALGARAAYIPVFYEEHVERAAETFDLSLGEPSRWFSAWSLGDGQAFATITADPSGGKLGERIKGPAYRFSRAGYSWLASALTLGNESWVPYGMALAGALAVIGILVLAMSLRERLGPKAWLMLLNPAIYLGFGGDTSEPLGVLLLGVALSTGSVWVAAALGVTRPTYLLALLGRWRLVAGGLGSALVLGAYSLWRFGFEGMGFPEGGIALPLAAYFDNSSLGGWILALLAITTVVIGVRYRNWTWVVMGIFVLSFGYSVTPNPINAWRAAGLLPVLWAFGPAYQLPAVSRSPVASEVGSGA